MTELVIRRRATEPATCALCKERVRVGEAILVAASRHARGWAVHALVHQDCRGAIWRRARRAA